jgi:hypothetical protein
MKITMPLCILLSFSVLAGCSKPAKTYQYFKEHPEEIQKEAKRCMDLERNGNNSGKDPSCLAVMTAVSMQCIRQKRLLGDANPIHANCDDPIQMLSLGEQGF